MHAAVAALDPGSPVVVRRNAERCELVGADGVVVGRLSSNCKLPPQGARISARVYAILTRRKDDEKEAYRPRILSSRWEVVLPELVIEH